MLTFRLFGPWQTHIWSMCTCSVSVPGNKRSAAAVLPGIYGFIQNMWGCGWGAPHVLLRGNRMAAAKRLRRKKKNLHGNKSYNLSTVCTLDWLRAITPTKKAFFFSHSPLPLLPSAIPLLPCVKLILWTFWKIFLFFLRVKPLSVFFFPPRSFVFYFRYGTWKRRLPSQWNSCQEFPTSPRAPLSLFVLPDQPPPTHHPTISPTPLTEALSPSPEGSSQVLTDWGRRQGVLERKGEAEQEQGLNRGRMAFPLTTQTRGEGGARPLLVII